MSRTVRTDGRAVALFLVITAALTACSGGGAATASSTSSASAPASTSAAASTSPGATSTAAASTAAATLVCAAIQAQVDAILGPGDGAPLSMGDRLCQFQQSGNELRVTVSDGSSYDDEVATQKLNVTGGSMTGPETVSGVGDEAVAFTQVGRPGAYLIVHKGAHMATFAYFDGSGADKADITKLYDLARS